MLNILSPISDSIIGIRSSLATLPQSVMVVTDVKCVVSPTNTPTPPTITITTSSEDGDHDEPIDGMLDRITHDLDYLLNRTVEIPVRRATTTNNSNIKPGEQCSSKPTLLSSFHSSPPTPGPIVTVTSHSHPHHQHIPITSGTSAPVSAPPSLSVQEVIMEESEE